VRFANYQKGGSDLVVDAKEGEILMNVADRNGIKIPRSCKTGLYGSCTTDL